MSRKWMLISAWKAPKEGGYMSGLYSFSENFGGETGHLPRKALFGNQWIRTSQGQWTELTEAKFSHDVTGKADRFDRSMASRMACSTSATVDSPTTSPSTASDSAAPPPTCHPTDFKF